MHYSILILPRPQVRTVPSVFFFFNAIGMCLKWKLLQSYSSFLSRVLCRMESTIRLYFYPKVPRPKDLKDFRRISLCKCNVIYKIISKCLVNRLRPTDETYFGKLERLYSRVLNF